MSLIVQKFGGTSVGSIERIEKVARRVLAVRQNGHQVVVVVSAMAKETDRLLGLVRQISPRPDGCESDVVAASGETIAAALTALMIQSLGGKARSILGFQLPILTDEGPTQARIKSLDPKLIHECLSHGEIPVVAGFQGMDGQGRITTLGRGGSDLTAVALAASLGSVPCEIYTDVDGVFTADPRICPEAILLPRVSYRFMIEAASLGARVMHDRSVQLGMRYNVPIQVKSSFNDCTGTEIGKEETLVNCVTLASQVALARVSWIGSEAGSCLTKIPQLVELFSEKWIRPHGITLGPMSLSFLLPQNQAVEAVQLLHRSLECN